MNFYLYFQDAKEKQRVYSLAQFQAKALSHALRFPNVKKVVYSTCSLHNIVRILNFVNVAQNSMIPIWGYIISHY